MKFLINLIFVGLFFLSIKNGVRIVYMEDEPTDIQEMIFFKKESNNHLDRGEKLLHEAENELIEIAKERGVELVEIFVIEMQHGEIPTESQFGKRGYVSLWVSLQNHNN
ncbi:hypothetical protein [Cecembia sp.]|uniref:hypothetical protein n=1 Tax=Cecembia sp. TaxID=1898110 RepID=UPI0025BE9AD5|nr:hypothetical protein [Cecembia sp.]